MGYKKPQYKICMIETFFSWKNTIIQKGYNIYLNEQDIYSSKLSIYLKEINDDVLATISIKCAFFSFFRVDDDHQT